MSNRNRILNDIELHSEDDSDALYTIFFEQGKFRAEEQGSGSKVFEYSLDISFFELEKNLEIKSEILEYGLSKVTKDDQLTIADVFMHCKYITLI